MSKEKYRFLDLFIFTTLSVLIEVVNIIAFNLFKTQYYTLSFAVAFGVIAIYRWNALGLIVPFITGLAGVFVRGMFGQDTTINLWLAQSFGYLALSICLLFFKNKNKREINKNTGYMIGYYLAGYLAVEIARALFQIGNMEFYKAAILYFSLDLLNIVFNGVAFIIALKQKNFVVDMNCYLEDINQKSSEALIRKETEDYLSLEELADKDEISDIALLDGGMLDEDDLKKLQADRRKIENNPSVFDKENEEYEDYIKEKKKKGN